MNTTPFVRGAQRCVPATVLLGLGAGLPRAEAQPPNYGHDFVTVDAPGNRRPNAQEAPNFHNSPGFVAPGQVNHRYRITRTEVTVRQWYEFVVAYAPYVEGSPSHPAFTSDWIAYRQGFYSFHPGVANYPANMSWRNAARYVNWLHNGKVHERWAFENGAYDTSTFVVGPPPGFPLDQLAHHPDAKFWIPTWDEHVKAAYYDPNRYGPGQEGYWLYPNSSDTPLISGHPWQGGETNAGIPSLYPGQYAAGSFPNVMSPWGLLDVSGGVYEKTESLWDPLARVRIMPGSAAGQQGWHTWDRIDIEGRGAFPTSSPGGFRVASIVCYADCDTSTGVEVLDVFDFLCFQNRYDAGEPYACNCDVSSGPGLCDIFDFLCFQNAYVAGCP